ncbi:MAG: hypothetical protein CVU39_21370 [Chloroflexi bacterium HGW-Chloroflexi-10]|nr:MAG: hypothetical protein CVU39_21370 [Chloroflexi bacterium HGW-Chloroflexi-10]
MAFIRAMFQWTPESRKVLKTWAPLAASWLLMAVEMPAITAVMARLANPEISLAAHGGVVFPIALIVEAPIIMLLSASTALSKDWTTYQKLYRFMMITSLILTVIHLAVAFTPLYDVVVRQILGVPEEIIEPGRIGLRVMIPWTWAIAYRRFQQGVMIRFGHSDAVGIGTMVRLLAGALVLTFGMVVQTIPGYIIGAATQAVGTVCEAIYAGIRVRPVLRNQLKPAPTAEPLTWRAFYAFYVPLALTSLLSLIWQPIGSAALSRMPRALESLAVWSVVGGLVFMLRSVGLAFNEVVVAMMDEKGSSPHLRRFAGGLFTVTTLAHFLVAVTPLSFIWFTQVSGLPPQLVEMARIGFWLALPMPGLSVLQSWFQGSVLYGRLTRGIPESMAIFLVTVLVFLGGGVWLGSFTGLYVGLVGFSMANFTQTLWLWVRSRKVMKIVNLRDRDIDWEVI